MHLTDSQAKIVIRHSQSRAEFMTKLAAAQFGPDDELRKLVNEEAERVTKEFPHYTAFVKRWMADKKGAELCIGIEDYYRHQNDADALQETLRQLNEEDAGIGSDAHRDAVAEAEAKLHSALIVLRLNS